MTHAQNAVRTESLRPGARRLVELMQQIGFGRIEHLHVAGGEPVFEPAPKVIREVKFDREPGQHPADRPPDFALKRAVVELLAELRQLDDAAVTIEVRHGLPFRLFMQEVARG
ncbi:MAG: hypothetical protein AB7Q00_09315 [Phycisphaerales bacterium]